MSARVRSSECGCPLMRPVRSPPLIALLCASLTLGIPPAVCFFSL